MQGNVTDPLLGVTIFSLDVASLLSGSSMRGEFERRMKTILENVRGLALSRTMPSVCKENSKSSIHNE